VLDLENLQVETMVLDDGLAKGGLEQTPPACAEEEA